MGIFQVKFDRNLEFNLVILYKNNEASSPLQVIPCNTCIQGPRSYFQSGGGRGGGLTPDEEGQPVTINFFFNVERFGFRPSSAKKFNNSHPISG